jgi:hypothetical protein
MFGANCDGGAGAVTKRWRVIRIFIVDGWIRWLKQARDEVKWLCTCQGKELEVCCTCLPATAVLPITALTACRACCRRGTWLGWSRPLRD